MKREKSFLKLYEENTSFDYLDNTLEVINEANNNYVVKYNRKAIYKRLLKRAELKLAHDHEDMLLRKYLKASKIRRETRAAIHEKYGAKAAMQVKVWLKARKEKEKLMAIRKKEKENK